MKKCGRLRWPWILAIQVGAMALGTAAFLLMALLLPWKWGYACAMWGVIPLMGALSAYLATRAGLSNYVSWALPPVCHALCHYLVLGYPPESAGMPLVTAGLALVAAATGEVCNERAARKSKKR